MKTEKNVQLNGREFGADVVAAPALARWLQAQNWPGLATLLPNSESPAFVQVEHLLCAIEAARFADMTEAEARALVPPSALAEFAQSVGLGAEELQGRIEHWLAGAAVHSAVRDRFRIAFSTGALQLLDGFTLAPKLTATTQQPAVPQAEGGQTATAEPLNESAEPAPAGGAREPLPLTTGDIAHSFDGLKWTEEKWKKPLGDIPKWLLACRVFPGRQGTSETLWNPVLVGAALVSQHGLSARHVRARFQIRRALKPWGELWKDYEAEHLSQD